MKKNFSVYELKVSLSGDRNTNRILRICGLDTLDDLSDLILLSLGFDDDHLYYFKTGNDNTFYYSFPDAGEKSTDIPIDRLHLELKQKLMYLYDFGDEWLFSIVVRNVEATNTYVKSVIIESKGNVEQYPDFDDDDENEDEDED